MIETIGLGVVTAVLFFALFGIRRLAWSYALFAGLGFALVFATVRLVTLGLDPGLGVLLGALGGSISTFAVDRGDRARDQRTRAILSDSRGAR